MKVAPGDVVHVKGTVKSYNGPSLVVAVSFGRDVPVRIAESDIVHVERAALKVGDSVWSRLSSEGGTILAIDEDKAWVKFKTGPTTTDLYVLERA